MLLKVCIILVNVSILKAQFPLPPHVSFCTGDVCYIKFEATSGSNWTEAQQTCRRFDSTLPIVDDPTHQISFEAAARCLTTENERQLGIWIGAKASYSQPDKWTWLNGSNYRDTRIESQEGYGLTYAFVQNTSTGVRAHASYPTENHFYICQYHRPTQADLCTNATVVTVEDHCFVKSDDRVSWFSARNVCLASAGDLASFSNVSLLEGKIGSDAVWVGLRSSQWNWERAVTESSSHSDVTFTLWNSGEPNDNALSCISTDTGEKFPYWRDYNCSESLPFICRYTESPPMNLSLAICETPSTTTVTSKHTDAASSSLRSSTTEKNSATARSVLSTKPSGSSTTHLVSSTTPSVSSNEDRQKNDTGSLDTVALGVGLGVGIGVPVIIALIVVVIVVCVRRKRRNSNAGGNSKSRKTAASINSQTTQENNRMEMNETQNGRPHYDNFSAQYATIPAAAAGPKLDAPSTQGTVYADLSFNQAGHS